jgi:hypothetical protein
VGQRSASESRSTVHSRRLVAGSSRCLRLPSRAIERFGSAQGDAGGKVEQPIVVTAWFPASQRWPGLASADAARGGGASVWMSPVRSPFGEGAVEQYAAGVDRSHGCRQSQCRSRHDTDEVAHTRVHTGAAGARCTGGHPRGDSALWSFPSPSVCRASATEKLRQRTGPSR